MRGVETYSMLFELDITHDYYEKNISFIQLTLTPESQKKLSNYQMIWKQVSINKWCLITCEDWREKCKPDDFIEMEVSIKDSDFYYVTGHLLGDNPFLNLTNSSHLKEWKRLVLSLSDILVSDKKSITCHFSAKEMFIEFMLIPQYTPSDISLKLTEERGRILFDRHENVIAPDKSEMICFRSREKVLIRNMKEYKFVLSEMRHSGERIINSMMPLPSPSNLSFQSPKDTITSYYYF